EIEHVFGISVPDDRAIEVETVGHLVEVVCELVVAKRGLNAPIMSIEPQVRLVVADQYNVPLQRITMETRFVEDLGC
ncbi:MAG: hypothetical protein AAFN41_09730, partial [Planctomycetota bacterium]